MKNEAPKGGIGMRAVAAAALYCRMCPPTTRDTWSHSPELEPKPESSDEQDCVRQPPAVEKPGA